MITLLHKFVVTFIIAIVLGTEEFLRKHPEVLEKCVTVSTTECKKDTGEKGKLQSWSRGHLFIVRPCGHIDTWHPLYRSAIWRRAYVYYTLYTACIIMYQPGCNIS